VCANPSPLRRTHRQLTLAPPSRFDLQYDKDEEDLYAKFKALQRQEEFLDLQEEYIKDEMRNLKRELIRAKEVTPRRGLAPTVLFLLTYRSFLFSVLS
jgi:hypothetical protein